MRNPVALAALLLPAALGIQAAPFLYVVERPSSIRVIDTANDAVVASIPIEGWATGVALNAAGTRAYVTSSTDGTAVVVSIIDTATNRVVSTIRPGPGQTGIAVNRSGTRVYVTNPAFPAMGTVSVLDPFFDAPAARIPVGMAPYGLALSPDGRRLYVTNEGSRSISVIDTSTNLPLGTIAVPGRPFALAVDSSGARLYVTLLHENEFLEGSVVAVDTASLVVAGSVRVGVGPVGIALTPAGTRAYVTHEGGPVFVIDTAALAVLATVTVQEAQWGIAMHPSGALVYVTHQGLGTVSVIDVATNTVVRILAVGSLPSSLAMVAAAFPAENYQGLWWNSPAGSESGWGLGIAHQAETLFATWFTYDSDGSGMWMVMSKGVRTGPGTYAGPLYVTTGPAFDASPWNPSAVSVRQAGHATLAFDSPDDGRFTYTLDNISSVKPITRQNFELPAPTCVAGATAAANYQDLWWHAPAGSESGWGVNITHQGDTLFAVWFTYGANGKQQWLVMPNATRTATGSYAGTMYRTTGPFYEAFPWNPALVTRTAAGSGTFTFGDSGGGTFSYTLDGISQSKPITRQVYAEPGTACR